jgi:hypothetical protein
MACVSLGSDVVMDFKELSEEKLHVPVRLWVISGEARWKWTHGIASGLSDLIDGDGERRPRSRRKSITFRTAKKTILK